MYPRSGEWSRCFRRGAPDAILDSVPSIFLDLAIPESLMKRAQVRMLSLAAVAVGLAMPLAAQEKVDVATIEKIKAEEMNHSQVMEIMSWLSDVYGPRLTWSPNATRARDWAIGEMKTWGLANVHD